MTNRSCQCGNNPEEFAEPSKKKSLPVVEEVKDCGDGSCGCGCGDSVEDSPHKGQG